MTRKTEQPKQNIDLETIARRNNEGGDSGIERGADHRRLYDAVVFKLRHRRQQLAGRVAETPASVSQAGSEKQLALCASMQAAHLRRENLATSISYDLWRFSCEMPDAPQLHDHLTPP
jgi:hypothetical protein